MTSVCRQMRPRIGDTMKSIAPYFQLYTDYMAKFEIAVKTLNEMSTKNEKFSQIIRELEVSVKQLCSSFSKPRLVLKCWQHIEHASWT